MPIRQFNNMKPVIHPDAYIDEQACIIGNVKIGANSSVWPYAVIRGDENSIVIGENTNIQDNCTLHVNSIHQYNKEGDKIIIGNNVTIGHRAILHGCTIHDNCLIGMGSIILDRATIPEYCFIGAGSIVSPNKTLQKGYLYFGSPAKKMRILTDEEIEAIKYSAKHYSNIAGNYKKR